MSRAKILAMSAALLCGSLPVVAAAQSEESAGVVTTVNGDATLFRAMAAAQPVSLHMRDEIFMRDRIHTQERSLVRVLLGGKALITVRELSVLSVTEEAGRVTVDLRSGKIGVAVVKARMRPGEVIEIRSPNATAAVRGTVFVVEVEEAKAGPTAPAPVTTTRVHLFHGALDVSARLDPARPTVRLAQLQSVAVTGTALGAVRPISRDEVAALVADLKPRQVQTPDAPDEFTAGLVAREQGRAVLLASALLAPPSGAIQSPLKGTVNGVVGTATNVTDATAKVLGQLMDTLDLDTVGATLNGLGNTVGGLGGLAGGTVAGLGGSVTGLGNTVGALGGSAGGLGNTVGGLGGAVGGLGGAVGAVGGLGGSVGGAVGGLGGAVGGGLGRLLAGH